MTLFGFLITRVPKAKPLEISPQSLSIEDWLFNNHDSSVSFSIPYQRKDAPHEKVITCRLACSRHGNMIYSDTVCGKDSKESLHRAVLGIEASAGAEWRAKLPIDMGFIQLPSQNADEVAP